MKKALQRADLQGLMATQALKDRLAYPATGTASSITASLPPECALIVLTSTLATPPTFILNHFLHETLKTNPSNGAVFLSFHYDSNRQALQMNKLGINIAHVQEQGRYKFIDGFSRLFTNTPAFQTGNNEVILTISSPWGVKVAQTILKALEEVKAEKPALFVDGLDFLLATSGDNLTANELLALLSNLSEVTSRMYIAVSADHSLLKSTPATGLTQNQSVLLTSLIHRAYSVISLRPLQTGTVKDVTGIIRVTRGGAWYDFMRGSRDTGELGEWEMLYRLEEGYRAKLFKHA